MRISRAQLDRLIQEEINEIFGFGKGALKDYPADEMVGITNTIWQLAAKANVEIDADDRQAIVEELEAALKQAGYQLHEQDLILGDELSIDIESLPVLSGVIREIVKALPGSQAVIEKAFKRGGITLSRDAAPQKTEPEEESSVSEYPADEMAILLNVLFSVAKKNELEVDSAWRQEIVEEFYKVLGAQGVTIAEQKLELGGKLVLKIDEESMPFTTRLVWTLMGRNPAVREGLTRLFGRGGITLEIGDEISDALWDQVRSDNLDASIRTARKAKPEPDEDQKATIKAEPVASPDEEDIDVGAIVGSDKEVAASAAAIANADDEDQKATIVTEPVVTPDEDEEDSKWDAALDKVQAGLDVLGAVGLWPPAMAVSKPATIASLILNTSRGMYGWALFDLVSLTPIVGEAMKAGKLGKGAKGAVAAARAKKFGTLRKLVKAGHAGKARTASKYLKNARAATVLEQGAAGIVELIPDDLLKKLINEKTDEGEPMIPWMIAQLGKVPGLGNKVENLQRAWQEVVSAAKAEKMNPALAEHKELDRMKVLAGIK